MLMGVAVVTVWSRPAHAIVGGELDGDGHPNVGTFVWPDGLDLDFDGVADWDDDGDGVPDVPYTGGNFTLIHRRVVVGAAHVFNFLLDDIEIGYYTLEDVRVSFSADPKNHPETWREIDEIILHPDYAPGKFYGGGATPQADVAVTILTEPVVGITPATLGCAGLLDDLDDFGLLRDADLGAPFTVLGYGKYGDPPNALIRPDGQRRVAVSEFMTLLDHWVILDQNAAHGNGGTADLDSGGPTFWIDLETGEEILVALVINGDATGVATGVNFRLDTPEVLGFLGDVMEAIENCEL
jgi:hypothetical protein